MEIFPLILGDGSSNNVTMISPNFFISEAARFSNNLITEYMFTEDHLLEDYVLGYSNKI